VALSAPAAAQRLDLDHPGASEPGEGRASLGLADVLIVEAEELLRDRDATPSSRARGAVRAIGADLLRAGEAEGGPRASLIGRTIALRRRELDGAIGADGASPAHRFVADALAMDLARRPDLSDTAAVERWLRDSLWPFMQEQGPDPGTGWMVSGRRASRPLRDLAALTDLGADQLLAVGEFEDLLDATARVPVYRPAAEDLRRSSALALGAMSQANSRLLAHPVRQLVRAEFIAAVTAFAQPGAGGARIGAAERLRRLGVLCEALVRAAGLDASNTAPRVLRGAVEELAMSGVWRDDENAVARLGLVIDIIERSTPDASITDERTLARQFRPAMRIVEPLARQSGGQTLEIAPRLLAGADAASDPAVLGAITAHARRMNDVRLLRAAADAAAPAGKSGEPEVPAERRFLAERFVTLGQDLGRPERRDLAISELRDLCRQVRAWKTIDGETELRAAADNQGWHEATDSQMGQLAGAIDRVRQDWIGAWNTPRSLPGAVTIRRLVTLRDNLSYVADAACVLDVAAGRSSLNSWPGWELSPEGAAWLTEGLPEAARAMTSGLVTGAEDGTTAPRKRLAGELALALTVGRLERRARALGLAALGDSPGAALAQLACGPAPSDAWMSGSLEDLAVMCHAIEEAAGAAADPNRRAEAARFRATAERAARTLAVRLDAGPIGSE